MKIILLISLLAISCTKIVQQPIKSSVEDNIVIGYVGGDYSTLFYPDSFTVRVDGIYYGKLYGKLYSHEDSMLCSDDSRLSNKTVAGDNPCKNYQTRSLSSAFFFI